jgi:hypothetical protein
MKPRLIGGGRGQDVDKVLAGTILMFHIQPTMTLGCSPEKQQQKLVPVHEPTAVPSKSPAPSQLRIKLTIDTDTL